MDERIGFGKDIHRLVPGRRFILGGVEIPFEKGLLGHSDADIVMHALADALLGALALGDIGQHFPSSDPQYRDMDSSLILAKSVDFVLAHGYAVGNIDIMIVLETPRLSPYIPTMRERLAHLLKVDLSRVSVKAGTNEGLDAVGRGEAAEATAVVLLRKA